MSEVAGDDSIRHHGPTNTSAGREVTAPKNRNLTKALVLVRSQHRSLVSIKSRRRFPVINLNAPSFLLIPILER